jgi:thiamine phosphate synthase YjbQ (UPF0047 family)
VAPRVQSALLGRSIHLPFADGKLCLDPYTDILCCDFDARGGRREIIVQVFCESAPAAPPQQEYPEEEYYE